MYTLHASWSRSSFLFLALMLCFCPFGFSFFLFSQSGNVEHRSQLVVKLKFSTIAFCVFVFTFSSLTSGPYVLIYKCDLPTYFYTSISELIPSSSLNSTLLLPLNFTLGLPFHLTVPPSPHQVS